MKANYLEDGTISVTGAARKEEFLKIWGGIGWPDKESGYLSVIGERSDGRYHALQEKSGGLTELGDAAVEAKDRLLIDCFWVDGKDAVATSYLRTKDGLCFYDTPVSDPPFSGPLFSGSCRDMKTATIRSIPESLSDNFRSALEKTRGIILAGRLLIHEANCPKLVRTLRQPVEDLLNSPVIKALVWVLSALELSRGDSASELPMDPWYSNRPRGAEYQ